MAGPDDGPPKRPSLCLTILTCCYHLRDIGIYQSLTARPRGRNGDKIHRRLFADGVVERSTQGDICVPQKRSIPASGMITLYAETHAAVLGTGHVGLAVRAGNCAFP